MMLFCAPRFSKALKIAVSQYLKGARVLCTFMFQTTCMVYGRYEAWLEERESQTLFPNKSVVEKVGYWVSDLLPL